VSRSHSRTLSPSSDCLKGDCNNGYGTYQYPNGNKYVGDFRQGKPHGKGILYLANGNKYLGSWENNWRQGNGKYTFNEGHEYVGSFVKNNFQGKGVMTYANGDQYDGNWQNNQPNGYGKYSFKSGTRYEGDFQNGRFHGMGTFYFSTGKKTVGEWVNGKPKNGQSSNVSEDVMQVDLNESEPTASTGGGATAKPVSLSSIRIWAVVVGVAAYTHMPSLRYTDDDAYQFFAFLKSPEGGALPDNQVRVIVDEDATGSNILSTMRSLFAKADENDVVLFYFSGHGIEGSFIPVDFDGVKNKVPHSEVRKILEASRAKHKIVLGDACHSGSLLGMRSENDLIASRDVETMLDRYYKAFENCNGGMALLMSSKGQEVSLEDSGLRSGVFSHYLVRGLKGEADANRDKIVSIMELSDFVKSKVSSYTAGSQTPVLTGRFDRSMPVGVIR
ncbi:MAG: caspase family protein, partial [Bacteroidota bacterium]